MAAPTCDTFADARLARPGGARLGPALAPPRPWQGGAAFR